MRVCLGSGKGVKGMNGLHKEVLRKGGLGGTGQDSACQENSEGRNRRGERLWAQVGSAGEAPPFCILQRRLLGDSHLPADSVSSD